MNPKLFSGIEVEGVHKGKKTLFVQGIVSFNKIKEAYDKEKPEHIYFGARYKEFNNAPSAYDIFTAFRVLSILNTPVTIEIVCSHSVTQHPNLNYIVAVKDIKQALVFFYAHRDILNSIQFRFLFGDACFLIPAGCIQYVHQSEYEKDTLIEV